VQIRDGYAVAMAGEAAELEEWQDCACWGEEEERIGGAGRLKKMDDG
jgi:hypothetical protein